MDRQGTYIAIDLKSFYASVECMERDLDPLTTHLVVADRSRTEKTICLAVSPSLKAFGIPGRARLFEVIQRVEEVNKERRRRLPDGVFKGASCFSYETESDPALQVAYITATPRMALYLKYSAAIYDIYLKYVAPEDIHVYSIDEVMMDVTAYLDTYHMTAAELAGCMVRDVFQRTGITATAGVGTNLYLCKVAMDIVAKHVEPDADGVRVAQLDERSYRKYLWGHRPLTDFWRVGRGYAAKLEECGLYTMGDIARCSLGAPGDFHNEDLLYRMFGINAELLIDHAWGYEPCTMEEIKKYKPEFNSVCSGQVLQSPYEKDKARLVVKEMADLMVLDLVEKHLVTDQLVLTVGYDRENLDDEKRAKAYKGDVTRDHYGRFVPKHAHGTANLKKFTSSTKLIMDAVTELFDRIVDEHLLIRRINITANHLLDEEDAETESYEQLDLFTDFPGLLGAGEKQGEQKSELESESEKMQLQLQKEKKLQKAMLDIKKKYGKNAVLRGMNLEEGATAIQRNDQIGGHRA